MSSRNSLAAVLAKNGLWHQLWLVALDEFYALRRIEEIQGLPETAVVDAYFRYHPEIREWAEAHVRAGTCETAERELRQQFEAVKDSRRRQREATSGGLKERTPNPNDWMAPFRSGPAIRSKQSDMIDGELTQAPSYLQRTKPSQADVNAWILALHKQAFDAGRPPPKRDADTFPQCRAAMGATDPQMREAMRQVPETLKRQRGHKDR